MPLPDINPGPPMQVPPQSPSQPQQVPPQSTVPLPPQLGLLAPRPDASILHGFGVQSEYTWDEGLRGSPLAAPRGSKQAAVWRVHTGMCVRVVSFVCQALNGKPPLPNPYTGNDNEVRISRRVSPATPTTLPTGEQLWTVVGVYEYLCQQPPDVNDLIPTAKHPLATIPAALNVLRPSDFLYLLGNATVTNYNGNVISY